MIGMEMSLAALCLGYLVFIQGSREKEGVRFLGRVIGTVVMIAAVFSFACSIMKCASREGCPIAKKWMCPMKASSKATP